MNGRMYDPMMSSFLSVDRYIQDPTSAQGFNRYAYCLYNPLRYVDPTGWYVGGSGPNGPLKQSVCEGVVGFELPEVTIIDTYLPPNTNTPFIEYEFTPNTGGGGEGSQWGMANNGTTTGGEGGSGGGNMGSQTIHSTPGNNDNQNANLEIMSDVLVTIGVYTSIESALYFNNLTRTWMDRQGKLRSFDFHGNESTGGMNSYGKSMSNRYGNAGRVLGLAGAALSYIQYEQATTLDGKLEYGFDTFLGLAGAAVPEIFGLPATIWFLGGKQATFWYARTTITPMIEQGLNPGLMEYQPFK